MNLVKFQNTIYTPSALNALHRALDSSFRIRPDVTKFLLTDYYLLHYTGTMVLNKATNGMINRNGINYHCVYYRECTRGHILGAPNAQYHLSFRRAKPEFNLPAYVLISSACPIPRK